MLAIKKAKLRKRRTTNFEDQCQQGISKSQFEGFKGTSLTKERELLTSTPSPKLHPRSSSLSVPMSPPPGSNLMKAPTSLRPSPNLREQLPKNDAKTIPSSRLHLRSSSMSAPMSPPSLSERRKGPSITSPPKSVLGRPLSKPPSPPGPTPEKVLQPYVSLETGEKSDFEEFFEKDLPSILESRTKPTQQGRNDKLPNHRPTSESERSKDSGTRVSQPVLWSSTLGHKLGGERGQTSAIGTLGHKQHKESENLVFKESHHVVRASEVNETYKTKSMSIKIDKADTLKKKITGSAKRFLTQSQYVEKNQNCKQSKGKDEQKTNLKSLVQNYGDWIKERGMGELHSTKPEHESSSGWENVKQSKTAPPQVLITQPAKVQRNDAPVNYSLLESEACSDPFIMSPQNPVIFSLSADPTEESLLTQVTEDQLMELQPSRTPTNDEILVTQNGELRDQNGLFHRLRDTSRPLSWITGVANNGEQHQQAPSFPSTPSPPPYPEEEQQPRDQEEDRGKTLTQPIRPVARVAALQSAKTNPQQSSSQSTKSGPQQSSSFLKPLRQQTQASNHMD